MRITHLCLAGTITDGWSYQENLLSKYHTKLGHEVSIITARWVYNDKNKLYKFPKEDYVLENKVRVIRLEIKNKDDLTYKFKKYNGIEKALEKTSPDILFIHGCQFLDIGKVAKYLKNHKNTKVYVDNHADFSNSATNFVSRKILHEIIWRRCAHVILPYVKKFYGVLPARVEFLKNVYHLPSEKIELLVMGGDDELIQSAITRRDETRVKYGIDKEDFLIVTGGKIDKWKKQTLLLMESVKETSNAKLKLIVFGSVDKELVEQVNALTCDRVQYIGWVNSEYSYDLFAAADLAVFPGRHSVFWEQVAAQGIPMIVKDWAGTHHIDTGNNVLFLHEDTKEEITSTISSLLNDANKYNEMLQCAKDNCNMFSYLDIARRSIQE